MAGALGWYFDVPQIGVVVNKFWAYADVDYRLSARPLADFVTYPFFNKYGMVNLGQVAGGVRLFYAESISGVINWSLAAPLFAINAVLLAALLRAQSDADQGPLQRGGGGEPGRTGRAGDALGPVDGADHQHVPASVRPIPPGTTRTAPCARWWRSAANVGLSSGDFRDLSLTMFIGLLAYDWLRVLIWFDHMGLRVATLVNLSFLGGDRVDEAAGRFLGHGARTLAIPDAVRRFATWAPLLIPYYIPRGADWDTAWTGAETLARGGPMPGAVKALAVAYRIAGAAIGVTALRHRGPRARKTRRADAGPRRRARGAGRPAAQLRLQQRLRRRRSACATDAARLMSMADERGGFPIDLIRRPLDPLQARGHFFYLCEDGEAPWSIGYEPARRAGDYRGRTGRLQPLPSSAIRLTACARRWRLGPIRKGAIVSWRVRLENHAGRARAAAARQLLRNRRPRGRRLCARSRFRRHARRDDLRRRPQRDSRAQPPVALGARRSRRDLVLRREAGRRRFARSAMRIRARVSSAKDRSPSRRAASRSVARKLDDEGKLWTFDPAASFTLEVDLAAGGVAEAEFVVGRSDNAVWALGTGRASARPGADGGSRPANASARDARRRAVAGAARALALRLLARRDGVASDPSHAASLGARDGQRTGRFRRRLQRRRGLFGVRQRAPQRPDAVPLRQRDRAAARPDRLRARPRRAGDRRAGLRAVPARGRRLRRDLRAGRRPFRQAARRSGDGLRRVRPARLPRRHALVAAAKIAARRPLRLRVAPFFDIALDEGPNESVGKIKDETVGATLLFENPRNDFQRGVAFAATSLPNVRTETIRARFFDGAGRDIRTPALGRHRRERPFAARRRPPRRRFRFGYRTGAGRRNEDRHRPRAGAEPVRWRSPRARRRRSRRWRGNWRRRAPPGPRGSAKRA